MDTQRDDSFWDGCALVWRNAEIVSGTPVLKGTRLPADTLVGSVESFQEVDGLGEEEAIGATLRNFPLPDGHTILHQLLAFQRRKLEVNQAA